MGIYISDVLSLQIFAPIAKYVWMQETRSLSKYLATTPPGRRQCHAQPEAQEEPARTASAWGLESTRVQGDSLPAQAMAETDSAAQGDAHPAR